MPDVRRATTPGSLPSEHRPGRTQTLPAIVFGGQVTALGVVRSLGEAGTPAYVVTPRADYASRSRWAKPLADGPPESPDAGSLAVFLEALPFERALLLPCSDDWVRAVAALPEAVRRRFPSPVAPLETLEHFLDKARFAALVERMDVPHPPTAVLVPGDERALDNFDFGSGDSRFFLKPTDSQHFVRHFGVKAFAVAGRAEARSRLAEIWGAGLESMLVQEYVPGLASSHYFVDGFVSADGRLAAQLVRRRLRMYPRDFGNSTYHVSVPAEEVAGAAGHLERMLAAVEYRGIFSA